MDFFKGFIKVSLLWCNKLTKKIIIKLYNIPILHATFNIFIRSMFFITDMKMIYGDIKLLYF